jgi:PhzF family phenazine biosynthesis protein
MALLPLHIIDAFASRPLEGNPAAVCLLDHDRDTHWMQNVAAEMNLSETAFLLRENDRWRLRWLTPKVEVDLCGHATLASAHVLWDIEALDTKKPIVFDTRSGQLICTYRNSWIEMDFPSEPPTAQTPPGALLEALGITGTVVGHKQNRMDYLVEVQDERALREITPDMSVLAKLPMRGVIVTARSENPEYDFVSRFFAPAAGVNEDPVTGSAHCCLAPYWAAKLGKAKMVGFQASKRGGVVGVALRDDRVVLSGQAVTLVRGELTAD